MAKISPVSIKYMIHANFRVEGALEKPDVIGAIFGQTEGLLGNELEMRELQKEGKIGRIEVELERKDKITQGKIKIPTALDQSETTLIAAAVETFVIGLYSPVKVESPVRWGPLTDKKKIFVPEKDDDSRDVMDDIEPEEVFSFIKNYMINN